MRDFGKEYFWGFTKSETYGSRFYVKQLYQFHLLKGDTKLSGILLNYNNYFFIIGLFLGYVLGRWTFFGPGSSLKDFFWV